jgi:flagellar hook-associated protein 3 FlgL
MATEISGLLDEAIATGNFQLAGQYLFAGHKTTTVPFTATGVPPTAVAYNGDAGAIEREITIGERVTINAPGDVALNDTFQALIQLRDNLLTGDANAIRSADIGALDSALGTVLELRGSLGATTNRFMVTRDRLEDGLIRQREMLANTEDVDILEVIVNLSAQEAVFDAALATAARAVQNTLMDFLR